MALINSNTKIQTPIVSLEFGFFYIGIFREL